MLKNEPSEGTEPRTSNGDANQPAPISAALLFPGMGLLVNDAKKGVVENINIFILLLQIGNTYTFMRVRGAITSFSTLKIAAFLYSQINLAPQIFLVK